MLLIRSNRANLASIWRRGDEESAHTLFGCIPTPPLNQIEALLAARALGHRAVLATSSCMPQLAAMEMDPPVEDSAQIVADAAPVAEEGPEDGSAPPAAAGRAKREPVEPRNTR